MKQLLLNTFFRSDDTLFLFQAWNEFTTGQFSFLISLVVFALGFFALIVRLWAL